MSFTPSLALAGLATILGLATPTTLCKLSGSSLPFATARVGTLSDSLSAIVLATGISHDHASPVLNLDRMHVSVSKLFHDGKDIRAGFRVK